MKNSKLSNGTPLPYRVEEIMSYTALSVLFLCGAVFGIYKQSGIFINDRVRLFVLSVISDTAALPELIPTALSIIVPAAFCALCAYTTFGAVIIPAFFALLGCAVGQALNEAYCLFSDEGLIAIGVTLVPLFLLALSGWLFIATQAICASLGMTKLALGRVPTKLPVFDFEFYRRLGAAIIFLLLAVVLYTSTYPHITSTVF